MRILVCIVLGALLSACAKPNRVVKVLSPTPGLTYETEYFNGAGAAVSDTGRVYARAVVGGITYRILVLEGDNLDVERVVWNLPANVTLCVNDGLITTFRQSIYLLVGPRIVSVTNHVDSHCGSSDTHAFTNSKG
jgi:hypothetical protein